MAKSPEAAFAECHEIMGDGTIEVCQDSIRSGCGKCMGCCSLGTIVFDGEPIGELPEGVRRINDRIVGCMQDGVCVFGQDKPLFCKVSPVCVFNISGVFRPKRAVRVNNMWEVRRGLHHFLPCRWDLDCPALMQLPDEYVERVYRVLGILRDNSLWRYDENPYVSPVSWKEVLVALRKVFANEYRRASMRS